MWPIEGSFEVLMRPSKIVAAWSSEVLMRSSEMGEVVARGGRSISTRARWGGDGEGEELPYLLERDGGGGGEGRAFHIYSCEIGEVLARGGRSIFFGP